MGKQLRPAGSRGIPDMRFINRELSIVDVARALDLRFDGNSKIHCWHPDRHQHGDRTASVGIRTTNNTVKCFGCDSKPMGPIDLVMDVLGTESPADAAIWIAARFDVPAISARRHVARLKGQYRVGYARGVGLLIRSGFLGWVPRGATQAIALVLLEFAEPAEGLRDVLTVTISYRAISRFSGITSPNAIRSALVALGEAGFLKLPPGPARRTPDRLSATYQLTPYSDDAPSIVAIATAMLRLEIKVKASLLTRSRPRLRITHLFASVAAGYCRKRQPQSKSRALAQLTLGF
jgi:hypothetical protein